MCAVMASTWHSWCTRTTYVTRAADRRRRARLDGWRRRCKFEDDKRTSVQQTFAQLQSLRRPRVHLRLFGGHEHGLGVRIQWLRDAAVHGNVAAVNTRLLLHGG